MRNFLKTHLSLFVIIAAAVLLELTSGIMYYSAQRIIEKTMTRLVNQEMNTILLGIRNELTKVEVTIDNMAWVVGDDLDQPEKMYVNMKQLVEHNSSFLGGGVAFVPNYYPNMKRYFEPYAVNRSNDTIQILQLGTDDYTQDDYFHVPVTKNAAHWSEPYMDPNGAQTVITTYAVPVHDSKGETVGVVYADISLNWLDSLMEESKFYKSTQRFLVTDKGNLLSGKDTPVFQQAMKLLKTSGGKNGCVLLEEVDSGNKLMYFQSVGGMTDWMLISVLDDSEVYGTLRHVRLFLLLLVLAGLLLIGFIVWRSSRNLERLRKVNAEKARIDGELRVANEIQQSMLPEEHHQREDVDIYGSLVPAREVGGDLYDYFIRDEKLFFCIGDVSGKGAASAMVMGVVHSLFRAFFAHENNPAHVMTSINEASCRGNDSNMFVTLFLGVLDLPTGHLHYCDAGHDAPLILENGQLNSVDCIPHLPVGVFNDVNYTVQEVQIKPGSTLFLYTDGLTEAKNEARRQFGLERVEEILNSCSKQQFTPKQILEAVSGEVHLFVGNAEQSDDLTMLSIHYTPKQYKQTQTETLVLKNDVHEVKRLSSFMKSVTAKLGVEQSLARQLRLAVEEAVVNVIDYAYPEGTEGDITIKILSDGQAVRFQITDAGVAFDPTTKEKTDTTLSAEERQIGGLGILLVRELMDAVNYERNDGKNVLTMMKYLGVTS